MSEEGKQSGTREKDTTQPSVAMSGQNDRALVKCIECNKPRVIYCNTKLDSRNKMMLSKNVREFEFTCGSHLFPPEEKRKIAFEPIIRPNLLCAMQVELCMRSWTKRHLLALRI